MQRGQTFDRRARKALTAASVVLFAASSTMLGVRAQAPAPAGPAATAPDVVSAPVTPAPPKAVTEVKGEHHRAASQDDVLATPDCGAKHEEPGIGTTCSTPMGLKRVFIEDGSVVETHGGDPSVDLNVLGARAAAGPADIFGAVSAPPCATDLSRDSFVHAIYAVPSDRTDRYSSVASTLIETVGRANNGVRSAAPTTIAGFKFRCSGTRIRVEHAKLPTKSSKTTFASIVGDLRTAGYKSTHEKYLVFLDYNVACSCAGLGTFHSDDRASTDNASNGGPDFAVIMQLAHEMPMVVLHELGHTMGAVQLTARNSSGAGHCNDGYDVMCYDDGGSRSFYRTSACGGMLFDCGANDYFDPTPASGSYLATHWNLASRLNKFLVFKGVNHKPDVRSLACDLAPSESEENVTCSFTITDDSPALDYTVDWGDGTKTTGTGIKPGAFTVTHDWATDGTFTIKVTAEDESLTATAEVLAHKVATCKLDRSGSFLVGTQKLANADGVDSVTVTDIAPGCAGYTFNLSVTGDAGVEICWMAGSTELSCTDQSSSAIEGVVPAGATAARLVLTSGVNPSYKLKAPIRATASSS